MPCNTYFFFITIIFLNFVPLSSRLLKSLRLFLVESATAYGWTRQLGGSHETKTGRRSIVCHRHWWSYDSVKKWRGELSQKILCRKAGVSSWEGPHTSQTKASHNTSHQHSYKRSFQQNFVRERETQSAWWWLTAMMMMITAFGATNVPAANNKYN